jgi:hypothetical protein
MSVDLEDLLDPIKTELSPPGTDLFPNATDDEWVENLRNGFWEAKLFDFFENYTEFDGLVDPITGTTDMPREEQQLIVLFAGARVLRNELRNLNTRFKAVAGPVSFEQEKSANLLKELLQDIVNRIRYLVSGVSTGDVYYIDSVVGRGMSIEYGASAFTAGSNNVSTSYW